jgi:hypothetical protein
MCRHPLSVALCLVAAVLLAAVATRAAAQKLDPIETEGQPLAGNAERLLHALEFLGAPLAAGPSAALRPAIKAQDARKIQEALDPQVLFVVTVNPESRVKVKRGPATASLQQGGYTPVLIKIINEAGVTKSLRMTSPQAGPVFSGGAAKSDPKKVDPNHFLEVEMFSGEPMTDKLSGLKGEYAIAMIYSRDAGKREATFEFNVGQGTQDLGFRGEVPILFDVRPAVAVKLIVKDFDGKDTTGRFTFKDKVKHVYPPKNKRIAPDFFFQDQVYRHSGGTVLLPPGELTMTYGRGPEYRLITQPIKVPDKGAAEITVKLERWINPIDYGFYSGDHHIHAAGCAHYTNPTEGVFADDMFLHVKGEALNVGCNLTWGPCFEFQRQFFTGAPDKRSEPFTVLRYDIEVSGFGSQLLGHVCLLNLRDQEYPGSDGTKTKGWPTWTTPLMKWAKQQGAFTGYAHSGSGLGVNPNFATLRLLAALDADKDKQISRKEAEAGLLPDLFDNIDTNNDGFLSIDELAAAHARINKTMNDLVNPRKPEDLTAALARVPQILPNLAVPEMDGIGAQEICVTTAQGLCDFISAMDTQRIPEWNCWYHIMNCGFPLKASGETDFPCITGSRVGQGRVYVQLGQVDHVDYGKWCEGLAKGRSYVSDGYAHALHFAVADRSKAFAATPGEKIKMAKPGEIRATAKVAFARDIPLGTSVGGQAPKGDTRLVELIVNGQVAGKKDVPADDKVHDISFDVVIDRSSWVALRQFPQMHTNPVEVMVGDQPIRISRKSALWCIATIEQLWRVRSEKIAETERAEAERAFQWAIERYRKIAAECPQGS